MSIGYFIFSGNFFSNNSSIFNKVTLEENNLQINETENIEGNLAIENQTNETQEEIFNGFNNPPITKEDYINLLGEIDYNTSYDLFFSVSMNDSALNYSEDPIEDIVEFLDKIIFWSDERLYKVEDYWASPEESLSKMKGDDEDYALLALALLNNFHDKNQSCYLFGSEEFTAILCYTPNYKISYGKSVVRSYSFDTIYFDNWWQPAGDVWATQRSIDVDKGNTENLVRAELRNFIKDFMVDSVGYCCTDYYLNDAGLKYENRDKLKFVYNKNEFYELETTKDLENWMYDKVKDHIYGQDLVK